MSSFMMRKQSIVKIVKALSFLNSVQEPPGFPVGVKQDELGVAQALLKMNQDATYYQGPVKGHVMDKIQRSDIKAVKHNDLLQAYAHTRCLIYQCSEYDIPSRPLFEWLVDLRDSIAHYLIRTQIVILGQTYEEKDWG